MDLENKEDVLEIIEGCKNNDRKYQHLLYKLTYKTMYNTCLRYSKDKDEAKDLLQEGYLKIFAELESFSFSGAFMGWIKRIMINNAIANLRKNKNFKIDDNDDFISNLSDDNENVLENITENNSSAEKLFESIHDLSPIYRTIFNLYYIEEISHKEIAEILNISISTSRSNLARAKMNFKKLYLSKTCK